MRSLLPKLMVKTLTIRFHEVRRSLAALKPMPHSLAGRIADEVWREVTGIEFASADPYAGFSISPCIDSRCESTSVADCINDSLNEVACDFYTADQFASLQDLVHLLAIEAIRQWRIAQGAILRLLAGVVSIAAYLLAFFLLISRGSRGGPLRLQLLRTLFVMARFRANA